MSKNSESEHDDGQKTVAELLAQYGADGPPTARRRRRRDSDEINETAPQTIINRILTDSGQMRAIRDDGQPQQPQQAQQRPPAGPGQGTGRFAAPPPPPPAPQRFEPSPQAGGPPHTSGRFAAPPNTGAHQVPGTGAHPIPPNTGQHPVPQNTGAHLAPPPGGPDADVTAQYPAISGDYPPPGTPGGQRLAPRPNPAAQTSQALPVPPPGVAAGEPVTEQFPRITDRDSGDAAATQVGATPPLTGAAPAGLDGDHDWFGNTGQQPYAALRGGRPAEPDYPTSQAPAVVEDDEHDAEPDEDRDVHRGAEADQDDDAERAEADADEDYDEYDEDEPSPTREWLVMLAQLGGGLVGGAGLWIGFQFLWSWMAPVALFVALAVIGGMVWLVRKIRKADDLQTIVLTVLVGLVVTISPAALLLVNR
ncbi:hypothetical protein [Allokutzneria albata]|uniref:Uncharacterized protein n=1 Tax=Allokutzneria albata TaxID=211114 RepID=A0A1G9Z638_ALLAB|nr:hypothetical protein [Allokutzneria albata]SDN16647.1 hypothetical protein SAMN04489726_5284 [Allokutzneria albata]